MSMIIKKTAFIAYNRLLQRIVAYRGKGYDITNTVVISATPRGGSTWLAEILATIPKSCIIWEPLHPGTPIQFPELERNPGLTDLGFSWRPSIKVGELQPEAEEFVKRILTGTDLSAFRALRTNPLQILRCDCWIVKFCRAHRLFGWMVDKFRTRPPILLIRHPCAVVESMLRKIGMKENEKTEKDLAITWCEDTFTALSSPKKGSWILVIYETLVTGGGPEIKRIFDAIGIKMSLAALKKFGQPSKTTSKDSYLRINKDPLAGWRDRLTQKQIQRILDIVKSYGLDFYSEALTPNYDLLYNQFIDERNCDPPL